MPDRRVLGKFLRSQHRPFLIMPPRLIVPTNNDPMKLWNSCKAGWKCFCLLTDDSVGRLPAEDTPNIERECQDFCESLLCGAKQCIPCGRKTYVPCSDKECDTPIAPPSDPQWGLTLVLTQFSHLEQKEAGVMGGRQFHRLLALQPQGLEHDQQTYWQVWTVLSHVPVSGNSFASQLVKNGAHRTGNREPTRLVNKQLWKFPTPVGHSICEPSERRSLLLLSDALSQCCSCLHRLELLRQAQKEDGNSGH